MFAFEVFGRQIWHDISLRAAVYSTINGNHKRFFVASGNELVHLVMDGGKGRLYILKAGVTRHLYS